MGKADALKLNFDANCAALQQHYDYCKAVYTSSECVSVRRSWASEGAVLVAEPTSRRVLGAGARLARSNADYAADFYAARHWRSHDGCSIEAERHDVARASRRDRTYSTGAYLELVVGNRLNAQLR